MKTKSKQVKCPYCGSIAVLRDGSYVHGDDNRVGKLYVCARYPTCNSYVGAYERTHMPMGTLANGELRHKRIEAHRIFDRLWRQGVMTRSGAYQWIQCKFGLNNKQAHIGNFSEYMCDELMAECRKALQANKIAC